jgi:hypothetical protein
LLHVRGATAGTLLRLLLRVEEPPARATSSL